MKFVCLITICLSTLAYAGIPESERPILVRDIGEQKWNFAAKQMRIYHGQLSYCVATRYDKNGISEWEFYLIRNSKDEFEEVTLHYNEIVKRGRHFE